MSKSVDTNRGAKWVHPEYMVINSMFRGPNKELMDRFERLMDPIDTAKAFKWLKIRFESSTMVLTTVTTFGVAVGATILVVEV